MSLKYRDMIRYWLFDVDDTLYPRSSGIMPAIGERIARYLEERMGLAPAEALALRQAYVREFGTTLRGLQASYQVDAEDYLTYVHDVPIETMLQPNAELDAILAALPGEKVIFTNSSRAHTRRVLAALGIAHHFSRIIDIACLDYICKPDPSAYTHVLSELGAAPGECVFIDDSLRNLAPARALGIKTVLVGDGPREAADFVIPSVLELPKIVKAIENLDHVTQY